jgi:hypothetical protein
MDMHISQNIAFSAFHSAALQNDEVQNTDSTSELKADIQELGGKQLIEAFETCSKRQCCKQDCFSNISFEKVYSFRSSLEKLNQEQRYYVLSGFCCAQKPHTYAFMEKPMCRDSI